MSIQLLEHPNEPQPVADSTTVDGDYVRELLQGAIEKGYNINNLMIKSGISPGLLDNPGVRVSFRQLADLSINLLDLMNDEFFGLVDKPQRRGSFKLMCHACISADTIGEAMQLFAEFGNLMENTWYHSVSTEPGTVVYQLLPRKGVRLRHRIAIDYLYSTLYRTLCWMANRQLPLLRVDLTVRAPKFPERYRFMFYDAPLSFGKSQSGLFFPEEVLNTENVRNKKDLEFFIKRTPLTLLTQTVPANNISSQVRVFIERQLRREKKLPSIKLVSERMGLHPQTFRRRLQLENTSYSELKANTRRDMAISLMAESDDNIAAISDALDFSEPSAFIRAFKKWTGVTPNTYRQNIGLVSP